MGDAERWEMVRLWAHLCGSASQCLTPGQATLAVSVPIPHDTPLSRSRCLTISPSNAHPTLSHSHLLLQRVNVSLSGCLDKPSLAGDVPIHCDHLSRWAETAVESAQRDRILPLDIREFVTVSLFWPGYPEVGGRVGHVLGLAEPWLEPTCWCDACHRALAPRSALATRPTTA